MDTSKYYLYAGKPTGQWSPSGNPEMTNTCGHRHTTLAQADKCVKAHNTLPKMRDWQVYIEAR